MERSNPAELKSYIPYGQAGFLSPFGMTWNAKRKSAFTLAETLITLMVIGVVAALTIPALMQQINDRALLKQRQTTAAKIAEGFANMRVAGDLETKQVGCEFSHHQ